MGIYKKGNVYWMIKQYKGRKIQRSLDTPVKRVREKAREEEFVRCFAENSGNIFSQETKKNRSLCGRGF